MSRTALLVGPAGSGKSIMAGLTAKRPPVHVIDIDNKIAGTALLAPALASGALTYETLGVGLTEDDLATAAVKLARNVRPKEPLGWKRISHLIDALPTGPGKGAGTWVIDSWTFASDHLTELLLATAAGSESAILGQRGWGAFLTAQKKALSTLITLAEKHDKDLIVIVHEKSVEVPMAGTRITYVNDERQIDGPVTQIMGLAVGGQFAELMPRAFEEVYGLKIIYPPDRKGSPVWRCRVKPEPKRAFLRTSMNTTAEELAPDFREIWT